MLHDTARTRAYFGKILPQARIVTVAPADQMMIYSHVKEIARLLGEYRPD